MFIYNYNLHDSIMRPHNVSLCDEGLQKKLKLYTNLMQDLGGAMEMGVAGRRRGLHYGSLSTEYFYKVTKVAQTYY